jgi:hypothetical protein
MTETNHQDTTGTYYRDRRGRNTNIVPNTFLRFAVYMVMIFGSAPTIYWSMGGGSQDLLLLATFQEDITMTTGNNGNGTQTDALDHPPHKRLQAGISTITTSSTSSTSSTRTISHEEHNTENRVAITEASDSTKMDSPPSRRENFPNLNRKHEKTSP